MTAGQKADRLVERGADLLRELSDRARTQGGFGAKLAPMLAEDAAFLRKLKPSLVAARIRGDAPTNREPPTESVPRTAHEPPSTPRRAGRGGPNPFVVAGIALAAGVFLAKLIDWRGHAHPRD